MPEIRKRETAYKLRIGDILRGTPIVEDIPQEMPDPSQTLSSPVRERFRFLELDNKRIVRVNVVANIVDRYDAEGEKKFATLTVDDGTGQIRLKSFGDDLAMFTELVQGDSIAIIGVLRSYNKEIYISPEIIKKLDPRYLLVRKLELEKHIVKEVNPEKKLEIRDEIIELIRTAPDAGGISTEEIILKIKSASPEAINSEVLKLIEDGMVYEPRPGRVRWLG